MKGAMKKISVLAVLIACCITLSGCLTHWFLDSTTRLQIENKSSKTVVEVDILAEDDSRYSPHRRKEPRVRRRLGRNVHLAYQDFGRRFRHSELVV